MLDLDFNLNDFCGKTDEELALLAKNDKNAAAVLMSRYSRLITIKSGIFANSEADSDDMKQEGLLCLLRAITQFDAEREVKFSTFAETCIVNRMKTLSSKIKKCPEISGDIDEIIVLQELSEEETPESIFLYKELISELWDGIDSVLSVVEKKTLMLSIEGLSYQEMAKKLDISEKSVDNAIQRARKKLRILMNKLNMTV